MDEFILARGEFAEGALLVVGVFDPDNDLDAEVVAGLPCVPGEDVFLE